MKVGDIVKTKTLSAHGFIKANAWALIKSISDSQWVVIVDDYDNADSILSANLVALYGKLESEPSLPATAIEPPHVCEDNRKTYDSGWSRYDYCYICDKKFQESA